MGWTFFDGRREATPLKFFARRVMPTLSCDIISAENVGSTVYAVRGNGCALVCLTEDNRGYKLIPEEDGPVYDDCPLWLLEQLVWPAPNKRAEAWRNRCAAHYAAVNWKK